jgi:hypothetical protein
MLDGLFFVQLELGYLPESNRPVFLTWIQEFNAQ